jgi:adenylylsulfate kinase-like enzyme
VKRFKPILILRHRVAENTDSFDLKPIIHIIGLPGAGKTTLSKKLARKLCLIIGLLR